MKQRQGKNTNRRRLEMGGFNVDVHIWSMSLSMQALELGICARESKWGSCARGQKINKGIEHIKSQCWVVRLTHWFPAVTYSIEHWMVDKVNKIEASVRLPHAANLVKSPGTEKREMGKDLGCGATMLVHIKWGQQEVKHRSSPHSPR